MKCRKIQKLISKFFDNQLKEHDNELLIFSHIKECKECSLFFRILEKLYTTTNISYEKIEPTEFFNAKLFAEVKLLQRQKILYNLFRLTKILVPVLAAIGIIISSFFIQQYFKQKTEIYSYELYPEEELDLSLFDILITNNFTTEFLNQEIEI